MELKALSDVLLTNATARFDDSGKVYLKAETLKDLVKNALIYEQLYRDKELFDEFYKKLLWWLEFYRENKENRPEVKRQLEAIGKWLEKKVLCGGEPEIVKGEVINYDEEKNLLNLLNISDFELKGEPKRKKIKLVGKAKRFVGVRKVAPKGSSFEGTLEVDTQKVESYESHAEKPPLFEVFKNNTLSEVINHFSRKVLEADKEFFADRGYSDIVRRLEDIEAESGERLMRVNYKGGVLPFGAELFAYERLEKGKGRKEEHHLSEIFETITQEGFASELFKNTREITVDRQPLGWLRSF